MVSNPRPSESQHRHPGTLFVLEHYIDDFELIIAAEFSNPIILLDLIKLKFIQGISSRNNTLDSQ